MKKAKAIFAAVVILVVAGASAGAWYLNENGYIGGKDETPSDETSAYIESVGDDIGYNNDDDHNSNDAPDVDTDKETTTSSDEETTVPESEKTTASGKEQQSYDRTNINEFLSVFSRVYFAENTPYSYGNYSNYDVLRFAYSHIFRTDRDSIVTKKTADNIGYYFGVSFDDVNEVLKDYLGITVSRESVYTENTYAFFKYEDGYFYTPAAEGIGYTNLAIADSVKEKDGNSDVISVSFTVYSDSVRTDMSPEEAAGNGEKYASGTAELKKSGNSYILRSYKIKN